jgi:hypothetical protein
MHGDSRDAHPVAQCRFQQPEMHADGVDVGGTHLKILATGNSIETKGIRR